MFVFLKILNVFFFNKIIFHCHIASVTFFVTTTFVTQRKERKKRSGLESHIQESGSEAEQAAESDSDIEVLGKDFLRVRTAFVFIFLFSVFCSVMDPQCGSGSSFLS